MALLETYQSNEAETPVMRKWFFRAFVVSILFHLLMAYFCHTQKLEQFTPQTECLVPRVFTVKNVSIDPKLLDQEDTTPAVKPEKLPAKSLDLPVERPMAEKYSGEVRASPAEAQPIIMD